MKRSVYEAGSAEREAVERDGAVCIRGLFSEAELAAVALHGAAGVSGVRRRRVPSVRFMGEDIRHAPRPWKTSPHFPGLVEELPAGSEMAHPLFPIVWPADLARGR